MDPVETATGIDADKAASNVVTETDDKTPATPPITDPAPHVGPPTDPNAGLAELRTMMEGFANSLNALTETVTHLLPKDAAVNARVPWTHRGSGKRVTDDE